MLLWSIQHKRAYEKMEQTGVLRADKNFIATDWFENSYLWMAEQNYFFISKIENYRKSFIHADLPLFCTFPKFFPKSKIDRQILPQIFSNFPK